MQITEPVTMLTDYALGAAGVYFAIVLYRNLRPGNQECLGLWVLGFGAVSLAAFLGGTYHGFALVLSPPLLHALWNITIFSIGMSAAFMISAVIVPSPEKIRGNGRWLKSGVVATGAGLAVQLTGFRHGSDFNHNDLFHVSQIGALYLLFKGASLRGGVSPRPEAPSARDKSNRRSV